MCQTIVLDPKTVVIKTDTEEELSEIIDMVSVKGRAENLKSFFDFAASIRKDADGYKFNREQCYAE